MKKLSLVLVVLFLFSAVFTLGAFQEKKEVKKSFVSVDGMNCKMCVAKVEKGLRNASGVTKAEVSLEKKMAYIEFDEAKTSVADIEKVITGLGYKANDKEAKKAEKTDKAEKADKVEKK